MKVKITATCVVEIPDEALEEYERDGECAFSDLYEAASTGLNNFHIALEHVFE